MEIIVAGERGPCEYQVQRDSYSIQLFGFKVKKRLIVAINMDIGFEGRIWRNQVVVYGPSILFIVILKTEAIYLYNLPIPR